MTEAAKGWQRAARHGDFACYYRSPLPDAEYAVPGAVDGGAVEPWGGRILTVMVEIVRAVG